MRRTGLKIGRVFGIPIFLHLSWFLIFVLITYSLGDEFGARYPQWSSRELWTLGIVTSLLFFGSVLFHELSHSVVARHYKIPVASITLFFFGGIASITQDPERAGQEFLIAAAGPASSYVLAGGFWLLSLLTPDGSMLNALGGWLAGTNLLLATFNLLPGFPLDGGRIFRSIIWGITKDYSRSTRIAARIGQGIAIAMMAFGLFPRFRLPLQRERRLVHFPWLVLALGGAAELRADHHAGRSARAARDRRDDLGDAYDWPRSHARRVRAGGGAHGKAGASGGV